MICEAAAAAPPVPNKELWSVDALFDPNMSGEDRATSLVVGTAIADRIDAVADELESMEAPPLLAAEHLAMITRTRDVVALIRLEVEHLAAGRLAEARAVDEATRPISAGVQDFERKYALSPCP